MVDSILVGMCWSSMDSYWPPTIPSTPPSTSSSSSPQQTKLTEIVVRPEMVESLWCYTALALCTGKLSC